MSHDQPSMLTQIIAGSFGAVFAETLTIPVDTVKVAMQVGSGEAGLIGTFKNIKASRGLMAMYAGLGPANLRGCIF